MEQIALLLPLGMFNLLLPVARSRAPFDSCQVSRLSQVVVTLEHVSGAVLKTNAKVQICFCIIAGNLPVR